jgi:hypothetical protein
VMQLVRVVVFFTVVPLAYGEFGIHGAFWAIALHPVAMVPVVWWFDRHFGIASWRHEILTLGAWPLGWALGMLLISVAGWLFH